MPKTVKIGTRKSRLALWQANHVADLLRTQYPDTPVELVTFTTKGDKVLDKALPAIGGKGLFTEELERALLSREIDCAVHSLKDLPTDNPQGLTIAAVPKRAPVEDVLISRSAKSLDELPQGAKIGTSSLRRAAQLRHYRADFAIIDLRGNVPTRIEKALDPDGPYDAIVLARAGVERLGLSEHITQIIPLEVMLPAPGQGAIGIQCRDTHADLVLFEKINDKHTRIAVEAERAFLNQLEGGCSVPVAAYYYQSAFRARVCSPDGLQIIEINERLRLGLHKATPEQVRNRARKAAAEQTRAFAQQAIEQGAGQILAEVKNELAG